MDGPWKWTVRAADQAAGHWAITLLDRHVDDAKVVLRERVEAQVVLIALAAAANSVLRRCKKETWSSRDIDELRAACDALHQRSLQEHVRREAAHGSYEIYRELDLPKGGDAIAPSTATRRGVRKAIRKKLRR